MQSLIRMLATMAIVVAAVPAYAADFTIVLDKMHFGPVPAVLHPGDTITWQNDDMFRHSATARDKSFDIDLPSKAAVKMTVGAAGTVDFFCKFHPGMKGTLVITQ
jgi:plastocyanin